MSSLKRMLIESFRSARNFFRHMQVVHTIIYIWAVPSVVLVQGEHELRTKSKMHTVLYPQG